MGQQEFPLLLPNLTLPRDNAVADFFSGRARALRYFAVALQPAGSRPSAKMQRIAKSKSATALPFGRVGAQARGGFAVPTSLLFARQSRAALPARSSRPSQRAHRTTQESCHCIHASDVLSLHLPGLFDCLQRKIGAGAFHERTSESKSVFDFA